MTLVSKNVYIDRSDDIVDKYNNTYHSAIKTKPTDVKSHKYNEFHVKNKNKIKFVDHARISK